MLKSAREHALCRGTAETADRGLKYWLAWEQGRLGATAPENPVLDCQPQESQVGAAISRPLAKVTASSAGHLAAVLRFSKAFLQHARNWFRRCSQREIDDRLAICQSCEEFTGSACRKCGCRLSRERVFLNKLAWRTEACPLGKWPALTRGQQSAPAGTKRG